jgi:hypothetical protein
VSFAAITIYFASQRVFVVVDFVIDSVLKLLDTPSFSSVDIALDYGLDDRGSRVLFSAWAGTFSHHHRVQNGSAPPPPTVSYPGGLSLGVKRPAREADHSPPSTSEVNE